MARDLTTMGIVTALVNKSDADGNVKRILDRLPVLDLIVLIGSVRDVIEEDRP